MQKCLFILVSTQHNDLAHLIVSFINKQHVCVQSLGTQELRGLLKVMKFNNLVKRELVASSHILIIFAFNEAFELVPFDLQQLYHHSALMCLFGFGQRPGFDCFKLCVCVCRSYMQSFYVTCKYSFGK